MSVAPTRGATGVPLASTLTGATPAGPTATTSSVLMKGSGATKVAAMAGTLTFSLAKLEGLYAGLRKIVKKERPS